MNSESRRSPEPGIDPRTPTPAGGPTGSQTLIVAHSSPTGAAAAAAGVRTSAPPARSATRRRRGDTPPNTAGRVRVAVTPGRCARTDAARAHPVGGQQDDLYAASWFSAAPPS